MIEAEPWSYHVDGSPVYSLADILADLDQRSSQVARALRRKALPTGGVRPGEKAAPDETAIILYTSGATGMLLALPEARTADWSALSYVVYGASPIPLLCSATPPRSSAARSCSSTV